MDKNGSTIGRAQERAKKSILTRYAKSGLGHAKRSWRRVATDLGVNAGYLRNVVSGKRKASIRLLKALNIKPDQVVVIASPCRRCGDVHTTKRCTLKRKPKTFEDHAREYDEWLRDPVTQAQLVAMLEWAETPKDSRPTWKS